MLTDILPHKDERMTIELSSNHETLSVLLKKGASFFPVHVDLANGKCTKKPLVTGWQKKASFYIDDPSKLESKYKAYGFHPETIGAIVIDLDEKGGKSGEKTLLSCLTDPAAREAVSSPSLYVDSPNGRHLYFDRASCDPRILVSKNGILEGVDLRGHHSGGWLVAPGSLGYSAKRDDWVEYTLEGALDALPPMPQALQDLILGALESAKAAAPADEAPDFIEAAKPEEMLPEVTDPSLGTLFDLVRALTHSSDTFSKLVESFVPSAVRDGNAYYTGDYAGNPGRSCRWGLDSFIIKDFADSGKGGDLLWWVERQYGLLPVPAARLILERLGFPDPSAPTAPAKEPAIDLSYSKVETASPADPVLAAISTDGDFALSDSGNAERLAILARPTNRYNLDSAQWMHYDGSRWIPDPSGHHMSLLAKEVARRMAREADAMTDGKKRDKLAKHALISESMDRRKSMVNGVAAEPGMSVTEEALDADPDLLNTLDGVIDLRTGELRPHSADDLFTQLAGTGISREEPVHFLAFLYDIFQGDEVLIDWMHHFLGCSLTGHIAEAVFPIWWGRGMNGKSVLIEIIERVMGTYCRATDAETWLEKPNPGPRDDIAALKGARFVWSSEPPPRRTLDVSIIKRITGGDSITCRHLYGRPFTYHPNLKSAFVTNHRPVVSDTNGAIWRRMKLIPFTWQVPRDRIIPQLAKLLVDKEGPAILGWMVEGAMKWYAAGMAFPDCPSISNATDGLQEGGDTLAEFCADTLVINKSLSAPFERIWEAYVKWNSDRNVRVYLGRYKFKDSLAEREQFKMVKRNGKWQVDGCGMKGIME